MESNGLLGTERNAPPHFAGRTDELGKLDAYAEYVFRNFDPSGGIVLIDGVPGAGKTQLMRQFLDRQQAGGNRALVLAMTTDDIPQDAKSLMFLIASVMPVGRRRALGIVGEERRARALSLAGVGRFDWDNPKAPELPITEMLRLSKDSGWWEGQSLIVSIDEIQTLEAPGGGCCAFCTKGCTAARSWWCAPASRTRPACLPARRTIRTPFPGARCT